MRLYPVTGLKNAGARVDKQGTLEENIITEDRPHTVTTEIREVRWTEA